jgi:methionine sulfoxide reductase heme-binding subunit
MAGAGGRVSVLQDPALLWYVNRAAGLVLLVLLTVATVLGVAAVDRRTRPRLGPSGVRRSRPRRRIPGFVLPELHRRVALVAVAMTVLHIVPAVLDDYVPITWLDVVVPFTSDYRPFWVGLGTITFDILAVVVVTALLRARIGPASWKVIHKSVYVLWPIAVLHAVGTGTDLDDVWAWLVLACVAAVVAAFLVRLRSMLASDRAARRPVLR